MCGGTASLFAVSSPDFPAENPQSFARRWGCLDILDEAVKLLIQRRHFVEWVWNSKFKFPDTPPTCLRSTVDTLFPEFQLSCCMLSVGNNKKLLPLNDSGFHLPFVTDFPTCMQENKVRCEYAAQELTGCFQSV